MSENLSWTRVDESVSLKCCPDAHQHLLLYYRTYTTGRGYSYSTTNDLISNFQKGANTSPPISGYREWAVRTFVNELGQFLSTLLDDHTFYIVPTPPSTLRSNSQHDRRVEEVAERASRAIPHIHVAPCVETVLEIEKSKSNTEPRSVERIYATLNVITDQLPPDSPNTVVVILDDVLTSGAHFEAIRLKLREHLKQAQIIGVFWARAVPPDFGS
jgi:predicted amidophosphoribosyltransferase